MMEVQDIICLYGESYRKKFSRSITPEQYKVMRHVEICRTAALGGHVDVCDHCDHKRISYNSCRDRNCPKCQFLKKEKWLENRLSDFLPIKYFHVVFTLPEELNFIMLKNQKFLYDLFFQCVSATLRELSADKKHIGANIGFIAVLHTWGQNLSYHPHIHCIVTGGGLSFDKSRWINSRSKFLIPVKAAGKMFRGKFLDYLEKEYNNKNIKINTSQKDFTNIIDSLYEKKWVVYSKPPFNRPETVFEYLAQYTHRIAISNHRIVALENDKVFFKWRDYSDSNKQKIMSLHAHEFIRRFLLHVLPKRFVKIRHFGLLSNRNRKNILEKCRKILKVLNNSHKKNVESWKEMLLRLTKVDIDCCPSCGKGTMITVKEIEPVFCRGP